MQADAIAIVALRPRLEKLAEALGQLELTLPTEGREDANIARHAIIRTINEYLIPRLAEPEAPVVAAVIGPTGTGKSTVVNSLANDRISDVGPLRPTTRNPVLWAHRDHGGRYWSEFVARVRERVGPTVEVVIGDDELTKQLTVIDTPPSEYVTASGRRPALDALALADLCVFVTSPSRYADISAWNFLRETRWRGVPMLYVLNRLPPDREEAVALLNDFASRLHNNGLLLEPDAAMVFGINEALGDRWHGGLDPSSVGALRNELGAVSNTAYRKTLVSTTAYTTGRNVVDRSRLLLEELESTASIADELNAVVDRSYGDQVDEVAALVQSGALRDISRHRTWSEAAVDLTAIITRRAGVAAQETARSWMSNASGVELLAGTGMSLWRHTEDTSWDVQGRLEEWEEALGQVVARNTRSGSLRPRVAKQLATKAWRLVVDPEHKAPWTLRRRLKANMAKFISEAQLSLGEVVAGALEVDAGRFRNNLVTDPALADEITRHAAAISALLHGETPALESVPDLAPDPDPDPEGSAEQLDDAADTGDNSGGRDDAAPAELEDAEDLETTQDAARTAATTEPEGGVDGA